MTNCSKTAIHHGEYKTVESERLRTLHEDIAALGKEREKLVEEARKCKDERDELHRQISLLRESAKQARETRDKINTKVKSLKEKRDALRKDLEGKRELFQRHKHETDKLHQHVKVDEFVARKKFRQLEWKLQTNPWLGSEEKDIIGQVAELEKQLAVHGALNEKKAVATQLRAEVQTVQLQIKRLNEELAAEAKQSQDAHERMIETYSKIESMRRAADERHKHFIQFKEKLNKAHAKLTQLLGERNLIRSQMRKEREEEDSRKAMEHQRLIGEQAEEKLKNRRKLTIHEFKVLLDQGKVWNNSEGQDVEE